MQLKGKKKGIIVSDLLFIWFCLNLIFLLLEKQKELAELNMLFEVATYFKYKKTEK